MANIKIESDEHWKALRKVNIGGSDVAALFGQSSFMSRYELWLIKAGRIEAPNLDGQDVIEIGRHMEAGIAALISKRQGWNIQKVRRYITHPEIGGMGCTLDYEITGHENGAAPLEIKWSMMPARFADGLPMDVELQGQAQLAVLPRRTWVGFGVLAGRKPLPFERDRHPGAIAKIEEAVTAFWQSIRDDKPPEPDFTRDLSVIKRLYVGIGAGDVERFEGEGGERLGDLCSDYLAVSKVAREEEKKRKAVQAEILHLLKTVGLAYCPGFEIKATRSTVAAHHRKESTRTLLKVKEHTED